jgi:hypothetical protein
MEPQEISPPPVPKIKRTALFILILSSTIFGMLLVPGFGAMKISPLVFKAPAAETNPKLVAFVVALVSYPILTILAIPISWILYALKKYMAAIYISLSPLLPMLAALLLFMLLEI